MSFQLTNVGIKMSGKTLISDIDLTLNPGEVLAVLGPNGAGKSTLFKVMAGEYTHYSGELCLNGSNYNDWSSNHIAHMVGVLPQSSGLLFPFSAFEVVMLGRLPHSSGRKADREIALAAMRQADVVHLAAALYPSLSGGEKQRVQLARVLCQIWCETELGDRYLLLDEPTSALDLSHQHHTLKLARQLAAKGMGVLAILHDLNLASQYADKLLLLSQGRVVTKGSVSEVMTPDKIKRLYGIDVSVVPHPSIDCPLIVTN